MTNPEDPFRSAPSQPPVWDPTSVWSQGQPGEGPQAQGQPAAGYGPPPQAYGQAYGQVPAYGYPVARQTSARAIVALVLAIGSFVVFPLIPAVVALALVPGAREEIDLSEGRVTGDGLLTAAKVVAWINIGLCLGGLLLLIAGFALFASVGFS